MTAREEMRQSVTAYMGRTGLSLGELAARIGYSRNSLLQLNSEAKYGTSDGETAARTVLEFLKTNPPEAPALPGTLHLTRNVRTIDQMISEAKRGTWVILYGPPGTQKSFVFEYRQAESMAASLEPGVAYIYASMNMAPLSLLREIAMALGAYLGRDRSITMRNILYTLRRRKTPVALVIDEAQHLAKRLDTLEILREVGDRGRIGLLLAGHDNVLDLFEMRGSRGQLEQWRSRVEQKKRRLPGLSEDEAENIVRAELGSLPALVLKDAVDGATVTDERAPVMPGRQRPTYVSARRLFNSIRDFKQKRGVQ
jgi:DNA transposition AAA+ family ATPase